MGEIDLTPDQINFALSLSDRLKRNAYVLISYDEFGQYFGNTFAPQLTFILSTNAWKMKLDQVLELVVLTYDGDKKPSWPIEELAKQVNDMSRRGARSEDRQK